VIVRSSSDLITRRSLAAISARVVLTTMIMTTHAAALITTADDDLDYRDGRLFWPGGSVRAAAGRAGVTSRKREGDGATPAGTFALLGAYYRADRLAAPRTRLQLRALTQRDAWVDDPADPNYNRLASLPYHGHTEAMWLDDGVYDLLVVIGYNMAPVVPGAGSAIFLHIARPDFAPTAGCIAVERDVLRRLLPRLGPASTIAIHG
jgi:L,D-peptidoglycan transpeptidase YkuD (ErfK/YbiS/YcfS/YnhG family)